MLLDEIKLSMRISHDLLDGSFQSSIDACKEDLQRVGVVVEPATEYSTGDLIGRACELFVKADNDYQGKGEQFRQHYEALRDSLSLDGKHNTESL